MSHLPDEVSFSIALAVNALVFFAAFRLVRRLTLQDRIGATLDAMLIHYLVQYTSVCLPGLIGMLGAEAMLIVATILAGAMFWMSPRAPGELAAVEGVTDKDSPLYPRSPQFDLSRFDALFLCGCLLSVMGYFIGLVRIQSAVPLVGDDALTYHLPAVGQWLQTGRLGLYDTWFFNPANTYSPLAGSTFLFWLIAPIRADLLAMFAQMPALILIFFAVVQIARSLGVRVSIAALMGVGVLLSRPFISESIVIKDDHFLAAFFVAAVAGLAPARLKDRLGPWRIGAALGLFFATKYTALLTAPVLLLAIDAPFRAKWSWRQWLIAAGCIVAIAGPWYLRNWILTGNPLYPVPVHIGGFEIFKGMFIPERSTEMRSIGGAWAALTSGYNSPSPWLVCLLLIGWIATLLTCLRSRRDESLRITPLLRLCAIGPAMGLAIFFLASHAALIRYAFPSLLLLFICFAILVARLGVNWIVQLNVVALLAAVSIYGGFENKDLLRDLLFHGAIAASLGFFVALFVPPLMRHRRVKLAAWTTLGLAVACGIFIYWHALILGSRATAMVGYQTPYPDKAGMWGYIDEHVDPAAPIAYTNLIFTRPLMGFDYSRRVFYVPTRAGVRHYHDLPNSRTRVTDQAIRGFVATLLTQDPQREQWRANLLASDARYLLVGKQPFLIQPPEQFFAASDPAHFLLLRDDQSGSFYEIRR